MRRHADFGDEVDEEPFDGRPEPFTGPRTEEGLPDVCEGGGVVVLEGVFVGTLEVLLQLAIEVVNAARGGECYHHA